MVCKYGCSIGELFPYICRLGLWSLEEQRNRADLELFKIIKGVSRVSWSQFFVRIENSTIRGHSWKLRKRHNQLDIRRHFFSQRCLSRWNSLTQDAVDAPSVNSFKNQLAKIRLRQMDFFMDRWSSKSYGCMTSNDPSSLL